MPAEIAEVVEVGRCEREVGARDAEERAEEGERAGGGGCQRAADPVRGSGRGQGAEVAGALAADQPDGQGEDRERQEGACGGRDRDRLREGGAPSLRLDREARLGGERTGSSDLFARQRPARLDEPAGRGLLPAVAAKTAEGDERGGHAAGVPSAEPRTCRLSILWTFVTARFLLAPMLRMTNSSVGTVGSARKSALGSIVAGSIPRCLSRAGVAT